MAILEMISFNVQAKNRNRVGGVMTPPYETVHQIVIFNCDTLLQWLGNKMQHPMFDNGGFFCIMEG